MSTSCSCFLFFLNPLWLEVFSSPVSADLAHQWRPATKSSGQFSPTWSTSSICLGGPLSPPRDLRLPQSMGLYPPLPEALWHFPFLIPLLSNLSSSFINNRGIHSIFLPSPNALRLSPGVAVTVSIGTPDGQSHSFVTDSVDLSVAMSNSKLPDNRSP